MKLNFKVPGNELPRRGSKRRSRPKSGRRRINPTKSGPKLTSSMLVLSLMERKGRVRFYKNCTLDIYIYFWNYLFSKTQMISILQPWKARLRLLFKKSVHRVIIMQRVSSAISCFALTRQTERELKVFHFELNSYLLN